MLRLLFVSHYWSNCIESHEELLWKETDTWQYTVKTEPLISELLEMFYFENTRRLLSHWRLKANMWFQITISTVKTKPKTAYFDVYSTVYYVFVSKINVIVLFVCQIGWCCTLLCHSLVFQGAHNLKKVDWLTAKNSLFFMFGFCLSKLMNHLALQPV